MVSPHQAQMEDQVQYLDSLQRSHQNQITNHMSFQWSEHVDRLLLQKKER